MWKLIVQKEVMTGNANKTNYSAGLQNNNHKVFFLTKTITNTIIAKPKSIPIS